MTNDELLKHLADASRRLGAASGSDRQWAEIAHLASSLWGYGLLTGLVYLKPMQLVRRVFSSDESVSPLGGFKKTGKGPWSERVLDQGLPYIGSDESDIRQVFSEADLLITKGLHSVLNIPIWYSGDVIGSLNLLHHRKAYDGVDDRWIWLMSSICTPIFVSLQNSAKENMASLDISTLDSV